MSDSVVDDRPRGVRNTANRRIVDRTARQVLGAAIDPSQLRRRLADLDREWDIERALQANAGVLACAGALLALTLDRRFALVPAVVGGFLVRHALRDRCPPAPALRRAGVRTRREIATERTALKALRGDFDGVREATGPGGRALAALRGAVARA